MSFHGRDLGLHRYITFPAVALKPERHEAMKTVAAVALVAGLATFAAALPAAASPSPSAGEQAIRSGTPASLQLAQVNQTRATNEQRGGDYAKKKKKKKKK
jgi:hypothetical protein